VNWFRKGKDGKFLWPGYGENMRILKWILDRVHGRVVAQETLLGWVPKEGDIDLHGLDISEETVKEATSINNADWKRELESQDEFFQMLGRTAPEALLLQRKLLLSRLANANGTGHPPGNGHS
jgi:phosphoenolpyruvate carboxykinase (GTP)